MQTAASSEAKAVAQPLWAQAIDRGIAAQNVRELLQVLSLPIYHYTRQKAQFQFCLEEDIVDYTWAVLLHFSSKQENLQEITRVALRGNLLSLDGENTPIEGKYVGLADADPTSPNFKQALVLAECVNVQLAGTPYRCCKVTLRHQTSTAVKVKMTPDSEHQGHKHVCEDHLLHIPFASWERLAVGVPAII